MTNDERARIETACAAFYEALTQGGCGVEAAMGHALKRADALRTKPESEWNAAIEKAAETIEDGLDAVELGSTATRLLHAQAVAIRSLKRDP